MRSYLEKLQDVRWQRKRLQLLEEADWKCRRIRCASTNPDRDSLHVHHKFYMRNTDPWDYPDHAYVVLCVNCHTIIQRKMEIAHEVLARDDGLFWAAYMLGLFPDKIRSSISNSICLMIESAVESSHMEFHPDSIEELFALGGRLTTGRVAI